MTRPTTPSSEAPQSEAMQLIERLRDYGNGAVDKLTHMDALLAANLLHGQLGFALSERLAIPFDDVDRAIRDKDRDQFMEWLDEWLTAHSGNNDGGGK